MRMIFQRGTGGGLVAKLPREDRVADGVRFLSLEQAAAQSGRSVRDLEADWLATWADYIPTDAPVMRSAGDRGDDQGDGRGSVRPADDRGAGRLDEAEAENLLRAVRYPQLGDEHWRQFMAICRRRRIDPWSRMVYPKLIHDPDSGALRVEALLSIEGLRTVAHATGKYVGCDDALYEYGEDGRPVKASKTVYRLVGGERCAFTKSVRWEEYRGCGERSLNDQMPHEFLGRCAEAGALRMAFPGECGGFHVPEEFQRRAAGGRSPVVDLGEGRRLELDPEFYAEGRRG